MKFPGMDPYLEDPRLWHGFHQAMIVYIRNFLQPLIRPRYIAAIEERVFLEGMDHGRILDAWIKRGKKRSDSGSVALLEADAPIRVQSPALEIHESYVAILDRVSGQLLVAVIELVSPTNKYPGSGRESYLAKQQEIRNSKTHLIEIDLLRTGQHVLAVPEWIARAQQPFHYLACVNRGVGERDFYDLYPKALSERLPKIAIPLAGNDSDVVLDVQAVLEKAYEDGCYEDRIDYHKPCRPPLAAADTAWVKKLLKIGPNNGKAKTARKRRS